MTTLQTRTPTLAREGQRRSKPRLFRSTRAQNEARMGVAMTLPAVLVLFLFTLGPALYAFFLSLFSWSLLNKMHYVGLSNFAFIFASHLFWTAVWNTASFAFIVVPTQTLVALFIAVLLNQNLPARGFLRLAFFFPAVSSSAVISIIFMWIYNKFGILNGLLAVVGIHGPNWLANPLFALKSIMIMNIWTTSGYFMVVFLSGLQAIPQNIYDAAEMDGANSWQRFSRITVPLLKPTTFFVVIMGVIGTLQMFDQSFILSGGTGGPLHSTTTLVLLIYQYIFSYGKVGYGAAVTVILFAFTMIATLIVNRWLGKSIEY